MSIQSTLIAGGVAFLAGASISGVGVYQWTEAQRIRHEQAQKEAQDTIDKQKQKIEDNAANVITDMQAAWEAGHAQARIVYRDNVTRGQAYVAATPQFANAECYVPAGGMQLLASTRSGVRAAADTGGTVAPVSGTGADPGGPSGRGNVDGGTLPATPEGRGTVGGMPVQQGATGSGGAVPGESTRGHPKPRPIK